jgi:hypothetical protein
MLVNNASDLQSINTDVTRPDAYALGRDINASSIANFTPLGTLNTIFDGQGYTISNLKIVDSTAPNVGLFSSIGSAGVVRNLNLTDVAVSALNSQFVGALAGTNAGTISNISATGIVQVGSGSTAGGLVGQNLGSISNSFASVAVGSPSVANLQAGGLVGNNSGAILLSVATGSVQAGDGSIAGGLVASNSVSGTITSSQASGNVTVGAASVAGGLVGANAGTITDSTASGAVTSTGANSIVGALVGTNTGTITNSTGSGVVTSPGANSTVTGGVVSSPPAIPTSIAGGFLPAAAFFQSLPGPVQVINNLVGIGPNQLAALNTAPVIDTSTGGARLPPQQQQQQQGQQPAPAPGAQNLPPGFDRRIVDIPPITETRLINNEALVQIATSISIDRLRDAVAPLGLEVLASENIAITGSTAVRLRIPDGRDLRNVLQSLAGIQLFAVVQPVYVFRADQQDTAPASRGDAGPKGDAAQYVLEKLKISDVHRMVRGNNVLIAVIDSQIDAAHPDLEGVIAESFSAVGTPEKPHSHGTGMAGAIASHQRLLGTAPGARLLAVHAFSTAANAESTTFNILKGIDWSVRQGARIINMSFAGPKDPSLERVLKLAYDKRIVLIAAAGNAGPKAPSAFPGADPNVIAVTATDVDDKLFTGANRGTYISVAAPGVDILVPAPEGEYQMTTGTSVAAAEVSGIVALLLERNPKLTPAEIRRILTQSARRLAPGERDNNFGSGLIDPLQALQLADPRTATTTPPPAPARPIRQR